VAAALRRLNPDVILLSGVRDWQACAQLAQTLKPAEYNVVVCSAFQDPRTRAPGERQTAILSKRRGYFSWSEPWRLEGKGTLPEGFAFAAIQFGNQRLAFFSVQLHDPMPAAGGGVGDAAAMTAALGRQWTAAVASFKTWVTNRLGAVVVASGGFSPGSKGEDGERAFLGAPLERAFTVPASGAAPGASPERAMVPLNAEAAALPGVVLNGSRVTCDLEFIPAKATAGNSLRGNRQMAQDSNLAPKSRPATEASLPPQEGAGGNGAQLATSAQHHPAAFHPQLFIWAAAAVVLAVLLVWARRRRALALVQSPLRLSTGESGPSVSSYTVVPQQSVTASASEVPAAASPPQPIIQLAKESATQTQSKSWPARLSPTQGTPLPRVPRTDPALVLHLTQWLKQKFLRRLIADRAGLMETQQVATLKLKTVEERVARIEALLQEQVRAYEQRIEELNRELLAAREENRELLRARIAQVRAEMEAARARLSALAKADAQ
jgi:hypothetical protein